GIGFATAKRIAEEGGHVALTGRNPKRLEEAKASLPEKTIVLQNDAADPEAAKILAATVKDEMGGIDHLFLNAGHGIVAGTTDNNAELYDSMMDANVKGPVLQMAELAPMITDKGSVVLTASVVEYLGFGTGGIYAVSKAALTTLARSFAADLAPRGIRVNSVAPGPIETGFFDSTGMSEEEMEGFAQHVLQSLPLGRFGKAEEVAAVVTFLLSDDASYVTGSQYMVDGGMTMR
ncbi:MAG: SDR family oxidoreductase, partial [Pseudomonadota bacterium]